MKRIILIIIISVTFIISCSSVFAKSTPSNGLIVDSKNETLSKEFEPGDLVDMSVRLGADMYGNTYTGTYYNVNVSFNTQSKYFSVASGCKTYKNSKLVVTSKKWVDLPCKIKVSSAVEPNKQYDMTFATIASDNSDGLGHRNREKSTILLWLRTKSVFATPIATTSPISATTSIPTPSVSSQAQDTNQSSSIQKSNTSLSNFLPWIIAAITLAIVIVGGTYWFWKRRKGK